MLVLKHPILMDAFGSNNYQRKKKCVPFSFTGFQFHQLQSLIAADYGYTVEITVPEQKQ